MDEAEQNIMGDFSVASRSIITICLIIDRQVCFLMNIFEKRSDLPFFTKERSQEGEKRGFVCVWAEIICSQTQLDDIAHEQTNEKEEKFASNDNTN